MVVSHRAPCGFDLERVWTVDPAGLRGWIPLPYTIWPRLSPVKLRGSAKKCRFSGSRRPQEERTEPALPVSCMPVAGLPNVGVQQPTRWPGPPFTLWAGSGARAACTRHAFRAPSALLSVAPCVSNTKACPPAWERCRPCRDPRAAPRSGTPGSGTGRCVTHKPLIFRGIMNKNI